MIVELSNCSEDHYYYIFRRYSIRNRLTDRSYRSDGLHSYKLTRSTRSILIIWLLDAKPLIILDIFNFNKIVVSRRFCKQFLIFWISLYNFDFDFLIRALLKKTLFLNFVFVVVILFRSSLIFFFYSLFIKFNFSFQW